MSASISKYSFHNDSERDLLISCCKENIRLAQEKLYRHYFPTMEKMVMRYTQDDDQIISILNDGFLRVFKKLHLYEGKGSFEGWIRRIIYHSVSNYFRAQSRDLKFILYEEGYQNEPTESSKHSLYYQDLLTLLNKLPEKHMKVFHMYAIEGFDHKEISNQLNINKNTCRWYLSEARKILQKEYFKKFAKDYNEAG